MQFSSTVFALSSTDDSVGCTSSTKFASSLLNSLLLLDVSYVKHHCLRLWVSFTTHLQHKFLRPSFYPLENLSCCIFPLFFFIWTIWLLGSGGPMSVLLLNFSKATLEIGGEVSLKASNSILKGPLWCRLYFGIWREINKIYYSIERNKQRQSMQNTPMTFVLMGYISAFIGRTGDKEETKFGLDEQTKTK